MKIFRSFYPDEYKDSTYVIDFQEYYNRGYRGILFDVDNTLVPHGAPEDERVIKLFKHLKEIGFKTCLISNNKEYRVKPLADEVGSFYVSKAGKQSPKNYVKAMEYMNTDKSDTYFVGDQLFTDVWGANRAGIKSVLVKPIDKHEEIQIILKRRLEWIVLHFYKKHIKKEGGKAGF